MALLIPLIYISVSIVAVVYLAIKFRYQYWAKRGVPYVDPVFPFGLRFKENGKRRHFIDIAGEIYSKFRGTTPFVGGFFFFTPVPLIVDLDLVHHILVEDFNYFHDRGIFYNEHHDPLSANLFSMEGQSWKTLRAKLTPTFTSGKMKFMYSTVLKVAGEFDKTLSEMLEKDNLVEIKDILARFTTDIIGTCAFGIECNTLKNPNAEFRKAGRLIMEKPRNGLIGTVFLLLFPELAVKCGVKVLHDEVSSFFMKVVRETVELREKNNIRRNDFMDLLIQMKNRDDADTELGRLTLEQIAAQSYLFFLAGFETSSTTMTFCLYELAKNPEIQEKARQEIESVLNKHNGEFSYGAMMDMPYLDCIINETLRKYPPVVTLIRVVNKDYCVRNSDKIISKGMRTFIPVYSIHHDPDIYPNPEIFDPNRFTSEEKRKRHPMSFLGFGDGPRNCIGLRFGQMQTRVGLVTLLKKYRFKFCSKTLNPMKFSIDNPILAPDGGLWLKIENL